MSIFKLIALPLIALIFSLTSVTTTYASNPMVVNEAIASIPMYKAVIHIDQSSVVYSNTPVEIMSKAAYGAGDLISISLYVNGIPVATSTTNFVSATYTPLYPGIHSVLVIATYSVTTVTAVETLQVQ